MIPKDLFDTNTALIVIDMTNDFVKPDGALPVPGAENLVPGIAELVDKARVKGANVIFACDNHDPEDREFQKWPAHCVTETEGAKVHGGLETAPTDYIFPKTRYSAFFKTDLDVTLMRKFIKKVVIVGVVTNLCVLHTVLDALVRDYEVTVVEEGVTGIQDDHHKYALELMEAAGAKVV